MSLKYHNEHPRTKFKVKASFALWQELTSSQEGGHWSKSAALPNPGPWLPTLQESTPSSYPICPLSLQIEIAPSFQHSPPSPSNLVNLSHLLDFPAPTHHRVQTDPAIKGGSREHWRVPRTPLHIKAPAALCG